VVVVGVVPAGVVAAGAVAAGVAAAAAVKHRLGRLAVWDRLVAAAAGAVSVGVAAVGTAVAVGTVAAGAALDGVVGNLRIEKAGCDRPWSGVPDDPKGNWAIEPPSADLGRVTDR
jgi:hypothetical protein